MTRDEMYAELERWSFAGADNQSIEKALWERCGKVRAVLISDMSGFTRLTRRRGILHFLALFRQAHGIGASMFARHRGRFLKTAADMRGHKAERLKFLPSS